MSIVRIHRPRRLRGVVILSVTMLLAVPVAGAAPSDQDVDTAYETAEALLDDVRSARAELDRLSVRSKELAEKVAQQEGVVERISTQVETARLEIERLRRRTDAISERLSQRAAEAYMSGPSSTLETLLGASSMGELADRIEFVGAVTESDAVLAQRASNGRILLEYRVEDLLAMESSERDALEEIRADEGALHAAMEREAELLAELEEKEATAAAHARTLDEQREDYLESLAAAATPPTSSPAPPAEQGGGSAPTSAPGGVFSYCPVDAPRVVTDSFGAPRYVGGYHPHKGADIMAPSGTPIRAPFSGYARDATNEIGGISVIVEGSAGWVYNAHMSRLGALGSVQAGEIIGYVGMTGASGAGVNHNHFEYHPNSLPGSWPESPYGYSIIDDAVNPYPLLTQVC